MGTQRASGSLYTTISNNVATIEFGHSASNSFTSELLGRLTRELEKIGDDPKVSVIVLKSEGNRAFCAGASFDELLEVTTHAQARTFFSGFAHLINAMRKCPKPIVCQVQGKAVGGGVGLIAAADYALSTEQASVRLSEISIGIAPLVIAPAVSRKLGVSAFGTLSWSPKEWQSAYWAKENGLFAKVFENQKELEKEVEHFALELASYPLDALIALKQVSWEGTEDWDKLLLERAAMTGELALSEMTKKTLQKFKKK